MRKTLSLIAIITFIFTLYSCEKQVDFNLGPSTEKVVIEGTIETDLPPYLLLTKSIGFFGNVDLNTLSDAFLHDATISVSDGTQTVLLKEYRVEQGGQSFYFYSTDVDDPDVADFKGIAGKTYSLRVAYGDQVYESSTYIPHPKALDSLWAVPPPAGTVPDSITDAMLLYGRYNDPDTFGNKIRYFTKRNSDLLLPPYYSVEDDGIVNGTSVEVLLSPGFNSRDTSQGRRNYFIKGDTVLVKWCSIDAPVFEFWRTLEFSKGATGNPFASPVSVTSNIRGGALGVWAGYGATSSTLIIPR